MADNKGSVITDEEYHPETGELLTVWLRGIDGKLRSLIPVDYRIAVHECPWDEKLHGRKKEPLIDKCTNIRYHNQLVSGSYYCALGNAASPKWCEEQYSRCCDHSSKKESNIFNHG